MKKINLIKTFAMSIISLLAVSLLISPNINFDNIGHVDAFSGTQVGDYPSNYYARCGGLVGDALLDELASFNNPRSTSYAWDRYEDADEAEGSNNKVICLYTRQEFDKSAHVSGSYSPTTWNREHIFTQTRFPNSDTDNHNIFACEGEINNIRGNKKFAEVAHNSSNQVQTYGDLWDCYKTSSYFEPCDEAKGEVARAAMYCCVYYGYEITDIFDSVETCLSWHNTFGVTNRDIYRNNAVNDNQGNRNPFVDHPEYANLIWGDQNAIIMPATLDLQVGETYNLNAYVSVDKTVEINYSSSNSSIVSVDSNGLLTALEKGSATINAYAYYGSDLLEANCLVSVSEPITLESIEISPSSLQLKVNEQKQLSVIATPSEASNNVTYSSLDESIASVSSSGLVLGLREGKTQITATSVLYPNISDTIDVEVVNSTSLSGTFEKVTSSLNDYNGTYLIVYESYNNLGYVLNPGLDTINQQKNYVEISIDNGVISNTNAINYAVNISGSNTSGYDISYNDETYIYNENADSNGLSQSNSAPSIKNDIYYQDNSTYIESNSTYLRFNLDWNGFRYYKSATYQNQQAIQLYKFIEEVVEPDPNPDPDPDEPPIEEQYLASDFAYDFLNNLHCDATGNTPPSIDEWNALKDLYNTLSEDEKTKLVNASSGGSDDISLAMERYDYIIGKYGTSTYENFIGRSQINNSPYVTIDDNLGSFVVVIVLSCIIGLSIIISAIIILIIKKEQKMNNIQ